MARIILVLILLFSTPSLVLSANEPTEESLIKAWEKTLSSNQHTILLKKLSSNLYEYETNLFPYKGQLKVNGAKIDPYFQGEYGSLRAGGVNAELVDLSEEMRQKYRGQYGEWFQNNHLIYDMNKGKWITLFEYTELENHQNTGNFMGLFTTEKIGVIILVLIVYLFFFIRKTKENASLALKRQATSMEQIEKSIELEEKKLQTSVETNQLLKEILNELKSNK